MTRRREAISVIHDSGQEQPYSEWLLDDVHRQSEDYLRAHPNPADPMEAPINRQAIQTARGRYGIEGRLGR